MSGPPCTGAGRTRLQGGISLARLVFPEDPTVERAGSPGAVKRNAAGAVATVFASSAGTQLADIQNLDGTPVSGSTLIIDAYSRLPLFLGPDGVDTVWISVDRGPVVALYARVDDRIDAIVARLGFSKTLVVDNPAANSYPLWRATSQCTVTAVRAYRTGGTGAAVNAKVNANSVLGVDLSVSNSTVWLTGTPAAPVLMNVGDTLTMVVSSVTGAPTQLSVQVDLSAAVT